MTTRSAAQIATATAAVVATGALGYCFYFDYMRRNNKSFRDGIRKQHKKAVQAVEAELTRQKERNAKASGALRAVLAKIMAEPRPESPEQKEMYFQENVAEGEKLSAMGSEMHIDAAAHFYRAMREYPQPLELLMIYQKVVPPPVFALVIELTTLQAPTDGATASAAASVAPPPRAEASVADVDDASPESGSAGASGGEMGSPNGASSGMGSGTEWERLSDGVPTA